MHRIFCSSFIYKNLVAPLGVYTEWGTLHFDILEKAYNLEFSETHPLANSRILNLRKCLKDILPDQYKTILDGSEIIEEIGLNLWSVNKEIIYDLCNKL
ncbi:MAG: hypothetical protein WA113_09430 [Desulfitobacteriaceae bacterium]